MRYYKVFPRGEGSDHYFKKRGDRLQYKHRAMKETNLKCKYCDGRIVLVFG